jgi:hypothetical protein
MNWFDFNNIINAEGKLNWKKILLNLVIISFIEIFILKVGGLNNSSIAVAIGTTIGLYFGIASVYEKNQKKEMGDRKVYKKYK